MLAFLALLAQDPHPSVFRAVFEDRPRQLIVVLGRGTPKPVGFVIHPDLGGVRKIWEGVIDYRGKVYDFSQNNSRAEGRTLWESPERVLEMPADGARWTLDRVTFKNGGWEFDGPEAKVTSPVFSLDPLQLAYVGFDEIGTKTRFLITLRDATGKTATEFGSSTAQDGNWQWNYKRLPTGLSGPMTLTVTPTSNAETKRLRNLRVFGDRSLWFDTERKPVQARLLGYDIDGPDQVRVEFQVGVAKVEWTPSLIAGEWAETYRVTGVPPGGTLWLRRLDSPQEWLDFGNGERTVRYAR